ncbi:MAG: hypothetical protein U5K79_08685 [Cyclobacteriaceae bacterium]|nr:hypothetical protein [Cyclobacteriaceae bacterium]
MMVRESRTRACHCVHTILLAGSAHKKQENRKRRTETATYEQFAEQNKDSKARTADFPAFEKEYLSRVLERGISSK